MTERAGEIGQDPGRALDRTALAWTRSALALATIAGLMLHAALVPAVALPLAAAAVWCPGHHPSTRRLDAPPPTAQPRAIAAVTAVTVAAAAVALVVVIRT